MSHSIPANTSQQPTEIIFTGFKVTGLQQYGSLLKRRYPKTYIKVRVGPEQYEQTSPAPRSSAAGWDEKLSFVLSKPDEQVTILLMQELKEAAPTCLGSVSETLDKLGSSGKEITKTIETKNYNATLSFRYDIVEASNCHVFTLIIGIDQYEHKPKLEGSVRDALAFKAFLAEELEVPESNMRILTDGAATRQGIIDAFRWLTNHPRIAPGDAIIVYYAGHGSRAEAPKDWVAEGGKIETICPIDEETMHGETRIHGIPDRTIAALLRKLSDKKGDNVTLIFDCCHSGGMSRGDTTSSTANKQGRPRTAPSPYPIPSDLDKDILTFGASRAGGIAKADYGFRATFATHILLAGCRPDETAWETLNEYEEPCGAFTNSLLRNLRALGSAYENHTTYADLLERIAPDLTHQHPQCEGTNKDRVLFDGRAPKRDPNAFTLKAHKDSALFEVEVGEIHGLCPGAIFSIRSFDVNAGGYQEIGFLEAATVHPQHAILRRIPDAPHFDAWAGSKAVVKSWNSSEFSLPIFVEDTPDAPIKVDSSSHEPRFRQVTRKDDAEVIVHRDEANPKMVTFDRLKGPIAEYANRSPRMGVPNSPMRLEGTLDAISHFHFHLARSNHRESKIGPDDIRIKVHRLTEVDTVNRVYATEGDNLMHDGAAVVPPSDDFVYGITIENRTEYSLYPYLFWFDPSDYSIASWYEPYTLTMAAPLEPAIKRKDGSVTPSTFGIGYGASTADPFLFSLADGEKRDVGFLKLFVSTRCIEMKFIEQQSPTGDQGMARSAKSRQGKKTEAEDTWEAFLVRIVVEE